jgi:hypothetical protein
MIAGRLSNFLSEVQELLESTAADPSSWFPPELHQPLQFGWEEVRPSFDMAGRYLAEPPDVSLLELNSRTAD